MNGRVASLIVVVASVTAYHLSQRAMPQSIKPAPLFTFVYAIGMLAMLVLALVGGSAGGIDEIGTVTRHPAPWILALAIVGIELGFFAMYRSGWPLSTGNIAAQAIGATVLAILGVAFFSEDLNPSRIAGLVFCVVGAGLLTR